MTAGAALSQVDLVGYLVVGLILLIPGIAACVAVVAYVNRVAAQAAAGKEGSDLARERLHDLSNQFAAFKIEVARDYATKNTITELKSEVLGAIERLGARFDRLVDARGSSHE